MLLILMNEPNKHMRFKWWEIVNISRKIKFYSFKSCAAYDRYIWYLPMASIFLARYSTLEMNLHTCAPSLVKNEYTQWPKNISDLALIRNIVNLYKITTVVSYECTSNKKDALSLFWSLCGISSLSIWNLHN